MLLKRLEINGFKSFAKKTELSFDVPITAIVGPNGSGKSNVAEALRWVLGEQSMKSLRGKRGEDLIFSGSGAASRLGRASVTIAFDNTEKTFEEIDFEEVAVTREVHRDGSNQYSINGSQVRLKDIIELLSNVSLGTSGHHIISQGEADRVLSANIRERREILEEALGLKIYHYKIAESDKKLAKTVENIKQVESLRREIAPHLRFLKKQVEEINKAAELKEELKGLSRSYFAAEKAAIEESKRRISTEHGNASQELATAEKELEVAGEKISKSDQAESGKSEELISIERSLGEIRSKKDELARKLGRLEGALESAQADEDIIENQSTGQKICKYCGQTITSATPELEERKRELRAKLEQQRAEKETLDQELAGLGEEEKKLYDRQAELKREINAELSHVRAAERALFDLKTRRNELRASLERLSMEQTAVNERASNFTQDIAEVAVLTGQNLEAELAAGGIEALSIGHDEARKKIERLKIKIEDMGGGGDDILKEFEETTKRDEYLTNEITDLETSAESLRQLMVELRDTLEKKFKDGLVKVNKEFQTFFAILFGGGTASLAVVEIEKRKKSLESLEDFEGGVPEEDDDGEETEKKDWGIEIKVNLPGKRIKGLEMLSGGERALTSIALIFAMSQVNPPPFLVLDETDAALDEANSRRYSDMIERLSEKSQLVLITHNRETMSRAGVLYGVTMGSDSISKLLSIKFGEASSYAK